MRLLRVCVAIFVALTCAMVQSELYHACPASVGGAFDGTSDGDGTKSARAESAGAANNNTLSDGYMPGPNCRKLHDRYRKGHRYERVVRIFGKDRSVFVQWGAHAPSRAAAAVLVAALRHRHNYRRVHLCRGPRSVCQLAERLPDLYGDKSYDELVVHVDAEWNDCKMERNCENLIDKCGVAGPRLEVVRSAVAPVSLQLYARLSGGALVKSECIRPLDITRSVLTNCKFLQETTIKDERNTTSVPLLIPKDAPPALRDSLFKRIKAADLPLHLETIEDVDLRARLLSPQNFTKPSFLFLDYDLWGDPSANSTDIVTVNPPPCSAAPCTPTLDSTSVITVADKSLIRQFAPLMFQVIHNFSIEPSDLRLILNLGTNNLSLEETACSWAYDNPEKFKLLSDASEPYLHAIIVFCEDDPDIDKYKHVSQIVNAAINKDTDEFGLKLGIVRIDCSNDNNLNKQLHDTVKDLNWQRVVGVVGPAASLATTAAETALNLETLLMFYDVPTSGARLNNATYAVTGRLQDLTLATRYFFSNHSWQRIGILSDLKSFASDFSNHLRKKNNDFAYREEQLQEVTDATAKSALQRLNDVNARIFFINTDAAAAATILCAANKLGLTPAAGYAWVAREWRNETLQCDARNMSHFTVSYSWRGRANWTVLPTKTHNEQLRNSLEAQMEGNTWPPYAASLADALWLLAYGVKASLEINPSLRYDLHGDGSTGMISENMTGVGAPAGLVQELRLSKHTLEQPLVFVHEWRGAGADSDLLSVWRVDDALGIVPVTTLREPYGNRPPPSDGTAACATTRSGDEFTPTCHDPAWFGGLVVVLLAPLALSAARRARLARLVERERGIQLRLMARCERTADVLGKLLVDRSALEVRDEIGAGHFGLVRLGLLRLPHKKPLFVAVKALREAAAPAEEAAFLREASTLSALAHEHVVRLVGVCVTEDGAPQLLMEHAFFGDLLRYLRERRHLAALGMIDSEISISVEVDEEAAHVAPAQLTRLAREAAAALAHLARRRLVHRDVRAANCLVDAQRTLKLADFGMARATGSSAGAAGGVGAGQDCDYEYVCRRRCVFPVPWMAPESVRQGVFSSASDAWSLGVLLLELATLGARPYGPCLVQRVLRYVLDGRRPRLPHDANFHTRELTEMCWHPVPEERASAATVCTYLTLHPCALEPALCPTWPEHEPDAEHATADSGFGEPGCELLSGDLRVSTL